jgi:ribosomal protein S18 acetylase RimI-like enzyme
MPISVRRAVFDDAAQIAVVHADARLVGYRGFISDELLDTTFSRDLTAVWVERLGAEEPPVVFVATSGEELVGYCMLVLPSEDTDNAGGVAELTRMSVSPGSWRSGVGTALMNEVIRSLQRDGWPLISLWVLEQNRGAIAFYSSFGFKADGARMTDPWSGQTEVRMQLSLSSADDYMLRRYSPPTS